MKKIIISTIMIVFLTGCAQTNVYVDEDDINNDINKNQNEITTENTDNTNSEKDNNEIDDKKDTASENIDKDNDKVDESIENVVYIEKVYYKSDEDINYLKSKVKDKTVYDYTDNEGNVILSIQTNTNIKDIRVHTLGEEFYNENFDIDKYLEKNYDLNYNNLDNISLDKQSALLIKLQEPETIPIHCISWINDKNQVKHYLLSYGFDENLNEIQKETIEIK